MNAYTSTIGLEIHAELKTRTKMFCGSLNDPFNVEPNVNVCPVCMAHPGTLPVINREAVRHVLRVGAALKGTLADYTEFDRKNYFYPDLPKGYQLSQYEYPLVSGGELAGIAITRVHLEEDTASSMHNESSGSTVIDFNRAGVPLMELVTEPVITSSKQAGDFARKLQLVLRTLGASNANMEKGEMRVEANVSISEKREARSEKVKLGTKVEIKNLNSFRAMERAVEYEIKRQSELLARGEAIQQETRGWDESKQITFIQRSKEGSADYRYFPDPDLPSVRVSEIAEFSTSKLEKSLPELPEVRRERYIALGIAVDDAALLVREPLLGQYFEDVLQHLGDEPNRIKLTSNYIVNDLLNIISDSAKASTDGRDTVEGDTVHSHEIPIPAKNFAKIIAYVADGQISSRAAKDMLTACCSDGLDPEAYAQAHGLLTPTADIKELVQMVIERNPQVVNDFRAGKHAALQYLIGHVMRETQGRADPALAREELIKLLG